MESNHTRNHRICLFIPRTARNSHTFKEQSLSKVYWPFSSYTHWSTFQSPKHFALNFSLNSFCKVLVLQFFWVDKMVPPCFLICKPSNTQQLSVFLNGWNLYKWHPCKLTARPCKMMAGKWHSFWVPRLFFSQGSVSSSIRATQDLYSKDQQDVNLFAGKILGRTFFFRITSPKTIGYHLKLEDYVPLIWYLFRWPLNFRGGIFCKF